MIVGSGSPTNPCWARAGLDALMRMSLFPPVTTKPAIRLRPAIRFALTERLVIRLSPVTDGVSVELLNIENSNTEETAMLAGGTVQQAVCSLPEHAFPIPIILIRLRAYGTLAFSKVYLFPIHNYEIIPCGACVWIQKCCFGVSRSCR